MVEAIVFASLLVWVVICWMCDRHYQQKTINDLLDRMMAKDFSLYASGKSAMIRAAGKDVANETDKESVAESDGIQTWS